MAMLATLATGTFASGSELRVYTTGAPSQAVKSIAARFEAQTGDHVTFTIGQPDAIRRRLSAGEQADVVILPARVTALLRNAGKLRADSLVDLARVGIGVVVRDGAKRPDISSAAAIRAMLREARSIVYPDPRIGGGSAGRAIRRMIEQMGLTDIVKPKLTLKSAIGGGVDLVAAGTAELGLFNVSEIVPIKGVTLVGALPAELQSYIVFAAGIAVDDAAPQPAAAFIKMLADPSARADWESTGMTPAAAAPAPRSNNDTGQSPSAGRR
jgi:molybdate transport system substrate-binding protein